MARKVKAVIGLSRGRVAFFEPISNIMLDLGTPVGYVYEGTNTSGLKSALGGAIYMISGSLQDTPVVTETPVAEVALVVEKEPEVKKVPEKQPEEVVEEPVVEAKKIEVEVKPSHASKNKRSKAE